MPAAAQRQREIKRLPDKAPLVKVAELDEILGGNRHCRFLGKEVVHSSPLLRCLHKRLIDRRWQGLQ